MKKLFLISTAVLSLTVSQAQQYYVGTAVNDTLLTISFSDFGNGCYPQYTQEFHVQSGFFPYVTGLNVGFQIIHNLSSGNLTTQFGVVNSGDTLLLSSSQQGYEFYFASSGFVTVHWIVYGTPTVANQNYICSPWMACASQALCQNSGLLASVTCNSQPNICTVQPFTSTNDIFQIDKSFLISPNPFSTQTTLQTNNLLHNATLTVDNCFGQTVAQIKNISGQTVTLSRDNLASGLYFLRLTENNKTLAVDKLVITDK